MDDHHTYSVADRARAPDSNLVKVAGMPVSVENPQPERSAWSERHVHTDPPSSSPRSSVGEGHYSMNDSPQIGVYFVATALPREQGSGPTVIISPLLSLMRNQIAAAARAPDFGTRCYLNSRPPQAWW